MEEANKLLGSGKKHLVMGEVVEAVSVLQEACSILAKTYGDTADECGEAFFWCGKALLDLAQMENSVLGNALEGVPEEDEEKPKDCNVESTENVDEKTRDELRVQVYDAMAEKKTEENETTDAENGSDGRLDQAASEESAAKEEADKKTDDAGGSKVADGGEDTDKKAENQGERADKDPSENSGKVDGSEDKENDEAGVQSEPAVKDDGGSKSSESKDDADDDGTGPAETGPAETGTSDGSNLPESEDKKEGDDEAKDENELLEKQEESVSKPEEAEAGEEEGEDVEMASDAEAEGEAAEKDSDEDEVGNLQLAWEMLEVAKVIYKRKDTKDDQLMAAQAHLKLGEVSAESGNYTQALEDFQECLKLQLKYLDSDSRLLAETHYQLGLTYSLNCQHSQAIEELNASISVIKSRLDKLQEVIDKAEGPEDLADERKEMDELKALLPEIKEKVEDATEALKTSSSDAEAVKDVLGVGSTSSGVPNATVKNCDSSSSSAMETTAATGAGAGTEQTSTVPVSDISHLVRKKRKPEESPVKASEGKKVKHDEGDADGVDKPHSNSVHGADGSSMQVESQ